jgi:hypothetical protein
MTKDDVARLREGFQSVFDKQLNGLRDIDDTLGDLNDNVAHLTKVLAAGFNSHMPLTKADLPVLERIRNRIAGASDTEKVLNATNLTQELELVDRLMKQVEVLNP